MATKIETPPAKAWAQVADQALNVPNSGSPLMRRYYKMPTSGCKNVLNSIPLGSSLDSVQNWVATAAGALDNGLSGANFTPMNGEHWILNSYLMEQIEAGEYMLFKALFSYTELDIDEIALSTDWSEQRTQNIQVTWQPYSVSPYIYCDEVVHDDLSVASTGAPPTPTGGHALRRHIEMAYTLNAQDSDNSPYLWQNANKQFCLTESEAKILKKVAAGVNPVFHKPVVLITQVFKSNKENSVPSSGSLIDRISQNAGGVDVQGWTGSYIFTGRAWTKSADTYYTAANPQGVTIYTLTYIDTWEGALDPDINFYGPNAWEFHHGPDGGGN